MWSKMLSSNSEIEVIGEGGKFHDVIEMIRDKKPDIVSLDINLSGVSGFDAVPLILKYSHGTRIITVSMHNSPAYAKKMLRLGAKAYITKSSSNEEVFKAVAAVMNGRIYICEEIKNILSDQLLNEDKPNGIHTLSSREMEIIECIKRGVPSKEIAATLNISVRTVEVHRYNILKKLDLKNSAALVNFINHQEMET